MFPVWGVIISKTAMNILLQCFCEYVFLSLGRCPGAKQLSNRVSVVLTLKEKNPPKQLHHFKSQPSESESFRFFTYIFFP